MRPIQTINLPGSLVILLVKIIGETPKHEAWMRSPEEFIAELTHMQYSSGTPVDKLYPQWKLSKLEPINEFMGKRFGFEPEDAGAIANRFSLFGYGKGGMLKNYC